MGRTAPVHLWETASANKAGVTRFVDLERHLLKAAHPLSVPPFRQDRIELLAGRSPLSADDQHLVVAIEEGREVACCAAFVSRRFQEQHNEQAGFIGCFAMASGALDATVAALQCAEAWLAERQVTRIIAPIDGSFLAGGLLRTAEFGREPLFPFPSHPASYLEAFEEVGYRRTYPLLSYAVDFSTPGYQQASRAGLERTKCRIRPINKRRWRQEIDLARWIYNEAFQDEWYFTPMMPAEWNAVFGSFKAITDPHVFVIAEVGDKPVGFCMGAANYSRLMRRLGGNATTLNQIRFLTRSRHYASAAIILIGVLPAYRRLNVARALAAAVFHRFEEQGLPGAEYCLVNTTNHASRALAASFGGAGRVLYHALDKSLAETSA